ncbi:urate hydroxylase PuuD [Halopseudomonas pachastrellae]|uniref:urate hydroxylase PuuD n=1 Tax=Halopseudomonas pachastrellae TaxID=254161 RepID=UPI003D7C3A45|tara:strand:- start:990 stop:2231 length:1242 start_codon:yes stop_codon:yes gene_type:complete
MLVYLSEWLSLIIRWFHVIAGVAWIGASFYFVWLDNNLREPPAWKKQKGIKGDLWAIHGGGFYEVAKYEVGPEQMPSDLHWFKWEAYSTLLSGLALLAVVYYMGNPGYLIDPSKVALSGAGAVAIGVGTLVAVVALYEALIRSPLARNGMAFGVVLYLILVAVAFGLYQVFAGRGAYIHVGAVIGTIMVGNVFLGIVPAQRALVNAVARGEKPGEEVVMLAQRAMLRSRHNNYLTLPVLFIMISNHYPMFYAHAHGWLALAAIGAITAYARHFFNLRNQGQFKPSILVVSALATVALIWAMAPSAPSTVATHNHGTAQTDGDSAAAAPSPVTGAEISQLLATHCQACHAAKPTSPAFQAPPAGIILDSLEHLKQHGDKVYQAAVATHYMPLGNMSGMSDEERSLLGRWLQENR